MFKELFEAKVDNKAPSYVTPELEKAIMKYADAVQADCNKAKAGHTYTVKYNKAYAAIMWQDGEWAHSFVVISNSSSKSARFTIGDIMKAGSSTTAPTGKKTFGNVLSDYKVKWEGY